MTDRYRLFRESRELDVKDLDRKGFEALRDGTRRKILERAAREPVYPSMIASELDTSKQKIFYHFEKLEEAGLIQRTGERKISGGTAKLYFATSEALVFDTGAPGEKTFLPGRDPELEEFFSPMLEEDRLEATIAVGSPEPHGEHEVRARDGHLAGDIAAKLGSLGRTPENMVELDTEIVRENSLDRNLVVLGGPLTNTLAREFNSEFPWRFDLDSFPYHNLTDGEENHTDGNIGIIAKVENPRNPGNAVILVAGIRSPGTRAAVLAFRNLEELLEDYESGSFCRLVRGHDRDGDGRVDSFEVL